MALIQTSVLFGRVYREEEEESFRREMGGF